MSHWIYIKKEKVKQTFEYHSLGETFEQEEEIAHCAICYTNESDLVGKSHSGGYSVICLECLEKCNNELRDNRT